ncbi:hypothetical protein QQS21_009903 [Conoideocrella luteorostrata]|uniref:Uncharacterized protein n=1 Tax=Conoideocrella luteorostrata TaxID=1105319 RepID=A0AAJ0CIR3_9HYPO|nr:hypothetical protein QQS21_009903 [Conoideocrella luteorostrata]
MVNTYITTPSWTIAPPPDGPIKLGHLLLADTGEDMFKPVNRKSIVPLPYENVTTVTGFKKSRSELTSGNAGIAAKILGLLGIGGDAGMLYEKGRNDVFTCEKIDTMEFEPTTEYIAEVMNSAEIQIFMKECNYKAPLYLITGFKIARGATLESSSSEGYGLQINGGLKSPIFSAGLDGKGNITKESESLEHFADFIMAFRARKIWYENKDVIKDKAHHKDGSMYDEPDRSMVLMQDGTHERKSPNRTLQIGGYLQLSDFPSEMGLTTESGVENGVEICWVIPNTHLDFE